MCSCHEQHQTWFNGWGQASRCSHISFGVQSMSGKVKQMRSFPYLLKKLVPYFASLPWISLLFNIFYKCDVGKLTLCESQRDESKPLSLSRLRLISVNVNKIPGAFFNIRVPFSASGFLSFFFHFYHWGLPKIFFVRILKFSGSVSWHRHQLHFVTTSRKG